MESHTILAALPVLIPSYAQREIVERVWHSIIKKIVLNRRINQTLEQMAQAIFKSWFVDFGPVKAKAQGGDPEAIAQRLGLSRDILDLFPSELEDSELGSIPKGWKAGKLGDIFVAKGGFAFKSEDFTDFGYPVVKIKNIRGDGTVDLNDVQCINESLANSSSKFMLKDGDIVIAMTGATVGKTGVIVTNHQVTPYLNQRVAKFESLASEVKSCWFVFNLLQLPNKFAELVDYAIGSAQPNISSSGIESVKTAIPTNELLVEYSRRVDPLFKRWILNYKETNTLSVIRDSLLPKLISGEISVAEEGEQDFQK